MQSKLHSCFLLLWHYKRIDTLRIMSKQSTVALNFFEHSSNKFGVRSSNCRFIEYKWNEIIESIKNIHNLKFSNADWKIKLRWILPNWIVWIVAEMNKLYESGIRSQKSNRIWMIVGSNSSCYFNGIYLFILFFFHFILALNWLLEISKLQMQQNETESREKPICLNYCWRICEVMI